MIIFMDSFDHYASANILTKWTTGSANIVTPGRNGNCIQVPTSLSKTLPGTYSTIMVGSAFYATAFSLLAYFTLSDGATPQIYLYTGADGKFHVIRGDGTVLASTASAPFSIDTWNYIEFKVTIHNSAGSFEVRANGSTILSGTGVDTQNSANAYVNILALTANSNYRYDDLYVCDTSGTINTDFRGDVKIECLFPTSDGYSTQWNVYPSGLHYAAVDETIPNDDTDYVYIDSAGFIDSYGFSDLVTVSGSIFGIQVLPYARKDDAGSRSITPNVYISGVAYSDINIDSIGNTYTYYPYIYNLSPATSSAWTIAEFNATEFGTKLVS